MIEVLFDCLHQAAPDTPAYRQAMADILAEEERLTALLSKGDALAKRSDAYARREREVAHCAFVHGFSAAIELLLDVFPINK